jgi:hypothetical protein
MTLEERWAEVTADLIELEENHAFLEGLFALEAGQWENIAVLCRDIVHLKDDFEQLQEVSKNNLYVTWVDYPHASHGEGYCLIIFYTEEWQWSNTALYNKRWFTQKYACRKPVTS